MASQHSLEMILLRQLASYLASPIWIMDESGDLLYYNEPAEELLGVQFDDAGPIQAADLAAMFKITDLNGDPLPNSELPVVAALTTRLPAHRAVQFHGLDGVLRQVEVTATPVVGQGDRFLGAFATFWESEG